MARINCDMDGVLADLERHYLNTFGIRVTKTLDNLDWDLVKTVPDFFDTMPPMADMRLLWDYIKTENPTVITGISRKIVESGQNKRRWISKHLGHDVNVVTCFSSDKYLYCEPGDILIDDWPKYRHRWESRGGIWVHHENAADTIRQLKTLGV